MKSTTQDEPRMDITIAGLRLKNPVMTASGTFGYGVEFENLIDLSRLGAIIVKGLSPEPSPGNKPPRIVETACGMLNAIGLENIGIEAFIRDKLPLLKHYHTPIIVNTYGKTIDEYVFLAERIEDVNDIHALEINVSCPNVKSGGVAFGVDPVAVRQVVGAVRKKTAKPLIVKLSPNVTDIGEIARAAEGEGADAVSLINTITGMAVDIHTRRPVLNNVTGGLSGPAIKPVALRMVWQTAQAVKIPIIGIGGIMSAEDAIAFFIVGADAVQIGTANFVNPRASIEILEGISAYLAENKVSGIRDIVGSLEI